MAKQIEVVASGHLYRTVRQELKARIPVPIGGGAPHPRLCDVGVIPRRPRDVGGVFCRLLGLLGLLGSGAGVLC